jgi:alkanesulfonate monooxygenase SsuD/methylene tetrahydromethanopterin reductase-like flavin-dependent oxidoreductase (luciferase family)
MRLGLVHVNMRQLSQSAALAAAARAAEAAGFDSLWAGEHVVCLTRKSRRRRWPRGSRRSTRCSR